VIWACGGDAFRIHLTDGNGAERDLLVRCLEGRTLKQAAMATEMLEEIVDTEGTPAETPAPESAPPAPPPAPPPANNA
jgi:hypothetical protein